MKNLNRWPGGFWSPLPPIVQKDVTHLPPRPYYGPQYIKDLLYRGKLRVTEYHPAGFAIRVTPCNN